MEDALFARRQGHVRGVLEGFSRAVFGLKMVSPCLIFRIC